MRSLGTLPVHRKVGLVGAAQLVILLLVVGVGLGGAVHLQWRVAAHARDVVPASHLLFELERDLFEAQLALEQSFDNDDLHVRDQRLVSYQLNLERLGGHWQTFARLAPHSARQAPVWSEFAEKWPAWREETLVIASLSRHGERSSEPETRKMIERSRDLFDRLSENLSQLMDDHQRPAIDRSLGEMRAHARLLSIVLGGLLAVGLALGAVLTLLMLHVTKRQQAEIERRDRVRQREAHQRDFESRLHRALEMAQTEASALQVVGRALASLAPDRPAELLLADGGRARFRRAASADEASGRPGCPVPTPNDCAAVRRGYALSFPTSSALDACPYLRERGEASCSAYCAPVTIGGAAVGVMHAVGPDGEAFPMELCESFEHVAARAGERIGYIQAFHRTETEAATDPLTGLLNRRSLKEQMRSLLAEGTPFAVAYGDLDRFKQLNDTHGHDVGDRALSLFARVLRDSLKKSDLCARWGGEEFVVVFPGAHAAEAKRALDRVRESLSGAVAGASVPAYTVSFGVADSREGGGLDDLLAVADHALLAAKRGGRDQVVVVGAEPEEKPEEDDELELDGELG